MEKCTVCYVEYPEQTLKSMVQIVDRKAYLYKVCPMCQLIVSHNQDYYYVHQVVVKDKVG